MIRKWLAIGIILLFVGVTIAPTINFNTVKASTDDDLVEVTTQACGIRGYGNTTVKLTREQCQNLESYLVEFRDRLNQTTSRKEAVPIFKEAVVELDRYGLLPKGITIEKVQRLVTGEFLNKNILKRQAKSDHTHVFERGRLYNRFCLIAGGATNCYVVSPLVPSSGFFTALWFAISSLVRRVVPVNLFGRICIDGSFGQIVTFGALGYNTISADSMYGDISTYHYVFMPGLDEWHYCGVRGFSGLQFSSRASDLRYFFGWCLEINVIQVIE